MKGPGIPWRVFFFYFPFSLLSGFEGVLSVLLVRHIIKQITQVEGYFYVLYVNRQLKFGNMMMKLSVSSSILHSTGMKNCTS